MIKDTIRLISSIKELPGRNLLPLSYSLEINGSNFHPEFVLDVTELAKSC